MSYSDNLVKMGFSPYKNPEVFPKNYLDMMKTPYIPVQTQPPITTPLPTNDKTNTGGGNKLASNAGTQLSAFLNNQFNQINQNYDNMKQTQSDLANQQIGHAGYVKDETLRQSSENKSLADKDFSRVSGMWNDKFSAINDILAGQVAGLAGRQSQAQNKMTDLYEQAQRQADTRQDNYQNALLKRQQAMGRNPNQFYQDMITTNNQRVAANTITKQNEQELAKAYMDSQYKQSEEILKNIKQDVEYQKEILYKDAEKTFRNQVQAAEDMAKAGLVDYDDAMAQIESNLVNSLANIESQAQESLAMQYDMIFQSMVASAEVAEALKGD